MGEALAARYDYVSSLFDEISSRSGVDLAATFFGAGVPSLHDDRPAQVGVFAASLAALEVLKREHGLAPDGSCGYSLGTYAAFVSAGCPRAGGRARRPPRGRAAPVRGAPLGGIRGDDGIRDRPRAARRRGGARERVPGHLSPLDRDGERGGAVRPDGGDRARRGGRRRSSVPRALKAEMLPIGFPMHSRSLDAVSERLRSSLEGDVRVRHPLTPLYAPMLGRRVTDGTEAAYVLSKQISRSFFLLSHSRGDARGGHPPLRRGRARRRSDPPRALDAPRRDRRAARARAPGGRRACSRRRSRRRADRGRWGRRERAARARRPRVRAPPGGSAARPRSGSRRTASTPSSRIGPTRPGPGRRLSR